jgi:hypothetical protein
VAIGGGEQAPARSGTPIASNQSGVTTRISADGASLASGSNGTPSRAVSVML